MITSYRNITYRELENKYRVKLIIGKKIYDRSFKTLSGALRFRDTLYESNNIKIIK